ncbi:Mov34/MPN/PAD-1 family protein [Aromatoleum toluclasticum]|uniref:Mov34/MPN/PAD-1 family protein n=1 Tax=Aromatoleum toluclasticum TaxID=92003 RepID=UPI000A079A54|nr:Mov34/MPN/PAD-1 family protein [Aromatoleum toluclasticum]
MNNRLFFYPDYGSYVLFTASALEHMYRHVQRRLWQKEAGGEIYAIDPDAQSLIVTTATGPNRGDRRTRHSYNPDIEAAARDRERQFAAGLHAVGLWHTHPEADPSPSGQDRQTTKEYLSAFQRDRERYLMVIVGNCGNPPNVKAWVASRDARVTWIELAEESISSVSKSDLFRGA